ncbi:pirin family protein [Marinobacterium jannaschii]|uniref:pirin family protein n=1 Tax=Marinobacterium jannaschii TaxID=64970 RepID=UPI000480FAF0|nr:pirin family protein [Marinobacterium jannaschii]
MKRSIDQIIPAIETSDGAGVRILRSVGQRQGLRVDPFLMLDFFSSSNPDDYVAGFPAHPHRGFETVTYMLNGTLQHRDHMGNEGTLSSGGVQWMTAGRGVIHEEMPKQQDGLMRGFQLWVNLPAAHKMRPAAYQNIAPHQLPLITLPGDSGEMKLIAGELTLAAEHYQGPVAGVTVDPLLLDLHLQQGASVQLPLESGHNAFIYLYEGEAEIGDRVLATDQAATLTQGSSVEIKALKGARLLLAAGRPIREPVVQYGPFVMNSTEEIDQALRDYREGVLTEGRGY